MNTSATIRRLNDLLRTRYVGGRLLITPGIAALPDHQQAAILRAVREFGAFDDGNDPHQEHDFGAVEIDGAKAFWKIDYYAQDMQHGSENPADPAQTVRVLTIMLASEY